MSWNPNGFRSQGFERLQKVFDDHIKQKSIPWYRNRLFYRPAPRRTVILGLHGRIVFTAVAVGVVVPLSYFEETMQSLIWQVSNPDTIKDGKRYI